MNPTRQVYIPLVSLKVYIAALLFNLGRGEVVDIPVYNKYILYPQYEREKQLLKPCVEDVRKKKKGNRQSKGLTRWCLMGGVSRVLKKRWNIYDKTLRAPPGDQFG